MDENTITMIEAKYEGAENEFRMWQQIITALEKGKEAEGYRTKKKPSARRLAPYTMGGGVYDEGLCPTCGNVVYESEGFCTSCGQALDWSKAGE